VSTVRKAWWQQATALVTVSAGGVITGFNFAPGRRDADHAEPACRCTNSRSSRRHGPIDGRDRRAASDAQLRAAIVNVARYYLKVAQTKTPAQMEALIWGEVSSDGTDHGESCAAFASLTLELAAHTTGLRAGSPGGPAIPWPLPTWADVRVDTNPASPQITSVVADAQAHGRWHPLGDGYLPQPGDWAVYDGHVAVVTSYSGGVLDTIAADSLPGLTVNAHSSSRTARPTRASPASSTTATSRPAPGDTSGQAVQEQRRSQAAPPRLTPRLLPRGKAPRQRLAATAAVPGLPNAGALAGTDGIPGAGPGAGNDGDERAARRRPCQAPVLGTGQLLGQPAASTAHPAPAQVCAHVRSRRT
jgi:hypothetical protein